MARTLQLLGACWLRRCNWLLATIALWQVAGCVIPPQEELLFDNHLPYIDWALVSPDKEGKINRPSGEVTTFSIEDAAIDIDGDEIEAIWYWFVDNGQPHRVPGELPGELSMTLDDVCGFTPDISDEEWIFVVVVISDQPGALQYYDDPKQPVVSGADAEGNKLPLIEHLWAVPLEGDCPQ